MNESIVAIADIVRLAETAAREQITTGRPLVNPYPIGSHAHLRFAVTVERLLLAEVEEGGLDDGLDFFQVQGALAAERLQGEPHGR